MFWERRMCGGEFENNLESTHKVNLYKAAKNKRDIKDVQESNALVEWNIRHGSRDERKHRW